MDHLLMQVSSYLYATTHASNKAKAPFLGQKIQSNVWLISAMQCNAMDRAVPLNTIDSTQLGPCGQMEWEKRGRGKSNSFPNDDQLASRDKKPHKHRY